MQSETTFSTPCCWSKSLSNREIDGYCVGCYGESNETVNDAKHKFKWMCIPFIWYYCIDTHYDSTEEERCICCWTKSKMTSKSATTTTESFGCCFTKTTIENNATTGQPK